MRLLVVRCLARVVAQAVIRARGSSGALCVLRADFQSDGGLSRLRFDRQRDFGVRGQFFRQFFDLLLRAFKVFGGGFGGRVRDFGCFRLQRLNPHCFRFRFNRFDFRFYGLGFDGDISGLNWSLFDLVGRAFGLRPSFYRARFMKLGRPVFGFGFGFAVRRSSGR